MIRPIASGSAGWASLPPCSRSTSARTRRARGSTGGTGPNRPGYAWRSLLDAGATLAFGQDAPLEPLDPWPGIAIAVCGATRRGAPETLAFGPDEAISLVQALRASTVGPWETVRDPVGGRLVPGSLADVIVLPAEPTETLLRAAHFESLRPRWSSSAARRRSSARPPRRRWPNPAPRRPAPEPAATCQISMPSDLGKLRTA